MERFFIVKDKTLIDKYEAYKQMWHKVDHAFEEFRKLHEIEAVQYVSNVNHLYILATEKDMDRFYSQIRKDTPGDFKDNSRVAKSWVRFCQKRDLKTPEKPVWDMVHLIGASSGLFENRYRTRLFDIDGVIYGSYAIDRDWELTNTDAFEELQPSEFWRIVEDAENEKERE